VTHDNPGHVATRLERADGLCVRLSTGTQVVTQLEIAGGFTFVGYRKRNRLFEETAVHPNLGWLATLPIIAGAWIVDRLLSLSRHRTEREAEKRE
jgi:hypothetical protein